MGLSRIFIGLWPINGRKHKYFGPTRLDYYSPYSSKILVLDSTPSRLSAHYSAYYSTPNIGRIVVLFRIVKRGRVIRRSLAATRIPSTTFLEFCVEVGAFRHVKSELFCLEKKFLIKTRMVKIQPWWLGGRGFASHSVESRSLIPRWIKSRLRHI